MSSPRKFQRARQPRSWPLQDAKARLSELIRKAQSEGPQHVTVHGRSTVVVCPNRSIHASRGRAPASSSWNSSARRRSGMLRSSIQVFAVPFAMSTCDRLSARHKCHLRAKAGKA